MLSGARAEDWQSRLIQYIRERRNDPFRWGSNDCATFACGGVEAMTGVNPAKPFLGYRSKRGAQRVLEQRGYRTLKDAANAVLPAHGFEPIDPSFAQRGDVVLVETEHGHCLGLVSPSIAELVIADKDGLAFVEQSFAVQAWRIR